MWDEAVEPSILPCAGRDEVIAASLDNDKQSVSWFVWWESMQLAVRVTNTLSTTMLIPSLGPLLEASRSARPCNSHLLSSIV